MKVVAAIPRIAGCVTELRPNSAALLPGVLEFSRADPSVGCAADMLLVGAERMTHAANSKIPADGSHRRNGERLGPRVEWLARRFRSLVNCGTNPGSAGRGAAPRFRDAAA